SRRSVPATRTRSGSGRSSRKRAGRRTRRPAAAPGQPGARAPGRCGRWRRRGSCGAPVAKVGGERDLGQRLLLAPGDLAVVLRLAPALQPLEHLALATGLDEAAAAELDLLRGCGQLLAGDVLVALGAGHEGLAGLQVMSGQ